MLAIACRIRHIHTPPLLPGRHRLPKTVFREPPREKIGGQQQNHVYDGVEHIDRGGEAILLAYQPDLVNICGNDLRYADIAAVLH